MQMSTKLIAKIKPTLIHFALSLCVAALAAGIVFKLWFPVPYSDFAGGTKLFRLLITVDVFMGPVLTFVAFNPAKTVRHLAMDLGAIGVMQLAALGYGLHTMAEARPVVLAAENHSFRVVAANDVKVDELPQAAEGFRSLSWMGPKLVGVRRSASGKEMMAAVDWALRGFDVGSRPSYWQPYEQSRAQVMAQAIPLDTNLATTSWSKPLVDDAAHAVGRPVSELAALPMLTRKTGWYVLVDRKTGNVVGYARLEAEHR